MYTGAPYFAAMAGLRSGADLVYIYTETQVCPVLHAYSPELIVVPGLERQDQHDRLEAFKKIFSHDRINGAWILGPGLGDNPTLLHNAFGALLELAPSLTSARPLVIDADGLRIFHPDAGLDYAALLERYAPVILTPNAREFKKLLCARQLSSVDPESPAALKELSQSIGQIGLVVKGATDRMYYQDHYSECDVDGSLRRVGGQGDALAGILATFLAWTRLGMGSTNARQGPEHVLAAMGSACSLTRHAAHRAFLAQGRSMSTPDLISHLGPSFKLLFGTL